MLRIKITSVIVTVLLVVSVQGMSVSDPIGETLGVGVFLPDIESINATVAGSDLVFAISMLNKISAPLSGRSNVLGGFIGIDAGQNSAAGGSNVDGFVGLSSDFGVDSSRTLTKQPGGGFEFIEWSSITAGTGGGINATVAATITQGSMDFTTSTATDPSFVEEFADSFSVLLYIAQPTGPGNITSTISFSGPLPQGSRLIVVDVDFLQEGVTLIGGGAPLALLSQVETQAGETSTFPFYDPVLGTLITPHTTSGQTNEGDASIFDVSGLGAIDIAYFGGGSSSGVGITIALPATDTDLDGVVDKIDNCTLVSNAAQLDTNGDGFGNACDPDLDNNGVVNFLDASIFGTLFGPGTGDGDFNGDGNTNFLDYAIFPDYFGGPPGPSGVAP